MNRRQHEPFVDRARYHDQREIDLLLAWCAANAQARPANVVAVGLAYGHGLNEYQIAAATLVRRDTPVTIEFPAARREAEIAAAERLRRVLDEPDWLAEAAALLASQADGLPDSELLYRARRRVSVPLKPSYIRKLVGAAGREACGTRISCSSLHGSRVAALQEAGLLFALFGSGHADSWAARLGAAKLELRLPRRIV